MCVRERETQKESVCVYVSVRVCACVCNNRIEMPSRREVAVAKLMVGCSRGV